MTKGWAGILILAAAAVAAVAGVVGAVSAKPEVHRVEKSPQQIREVWTPERLEEAKKGNPMPVITE